MIKALDFHYLKHFYLYAKNYKEPALLGIVMMPLSVACNLLFPWLFIQVIDTKLMAGEMNGLYTLVFWLVFVLCINYLADSCLNINAHLIHISTDFIFDGNDGPYSEDDFPNPLSYYGESKFKSEKLLITHSCKSSILRTIVLFGVGDNLTKNNIVLWAKEQLENNNKINIIDDKFRAPTLAEDLAEACISAANNKAFGVFHVSGKDLMSIYDLVVNIANFFKFDINLINRINSTALNQKAKRPHKTGFVLDKAKNILNFTPHTFIESLEIIDKQLNIKT